MRFTISGLVALVMSSNLATAFDIPSTACFKVPSVLLAVNTERLVDQWKQEICNKGCQVKMPDYDAKLREFAVAMIEAEAPKMGTSNLVPSYTTLFDRLFQMGQEKCGLSEADLCSEDITQLKVSVHCIQRNSWQMILENIATLLPLLTTNCQEQYDFFSNADLWEKTFPGYLQEFAKTC